MDGTNGIQFFYFLGHLSVKMFMLFTIANVLVCVNVLVLTLTFWLLKKPQKSKIVWPEFKEVDTKPTTTKPSLAEFTNAETGKREGWVKKTIWVRKD